MCVMASQIRNTSRPPSSAGIGRRFRIPRFTVSIRVMFNIFASTSLPAVVSWYFRRSFPTTFTRDPDRSCHILPGDLPLHQHRQALPGHRSRSSASHTRNTEAVQSGQFYEIRITDADHIAAFASHRTSASALQFPFHHPFHIPPLLLRHGKSE